MERNAEVKLARKGLDLLVANDVMKPGSGFGTETNEVTLFSAGGAVERLPLLTKPEVARIIWDRLVPLLRARPASDGDHNP